MNNDMQQHQVEGQVVSVESEAHCGLSEVNNNESARQFAASPLDLPAEQFRAGLDRRKENRGALMEWVRAALIEGIDFGCIKTKRGPSKPSLWKPGAEKICGMLGVTVHFPTLKDYEQAALQCTEVNNIIIRCEIMDAGGRVVADGIGARSLKQDYGDINKALKMAEKSAHIDATLRMAGLSEVFTQDLEDMRPQTITQQSSSTAAKSPPTPSRVAVYSNGSGPVPSAKNGTSFLISSSQFKKLEGRINKLGLDKERVKAWLLNATNGKVKYFSHLNQQQYKKLDDKLDGWAEHNAIQNNENNGVKEIAMTYQ